MPFCHWNSTWRIAFEPTKSQALQIDHHRPPGGLPAIRFNGFEVPDADQIKLLGVVFDRQLRFIAHIRSRAAQTASCTSSESVPFTWPNHRLQGLCAPNIKVLPPGMDGCICAHSRSPVHCATPFTLYHWPPVLLVEPFTSSLCARFFLHFQTSLSAGHIPATLRPPRTRHS